jgi:plasmid maintenance system antidote protein VapI
MTLWLRGDETYCGSFNLDAEAVMELLGIKRTRLTQISGRELRVARIKRGRYIVPVYRPEDVEQYRSWSRATATHLKSTQAVTEATENLKDQTSQLLHKTEALLQNLADSMAEDLLSRVALPLSKMLIQGLIPALQTEAKAKMSHMEFLNEALGQNLEYSLRETGQHLTAQQSLLQKTVTKRLDHLSQGLALQLKSTLDSQHQNQAASLLLLQRVTDLMILIQNVDTQVKEHAQELANLNASLAEKKSPWDSPSLLRQKSLSSEVRRLKFHDRAPKIASTQPGANIPMGRFKMVL